MNKCKAKCVVLKFVVVINYKINNNLYLFDNKTSIFSILPVFSILSYAFLLSKLKWLTEQKKLYIIIFLTKFVNL